MKKTDIIIIGAGISGLYAAAALSAKGRSVRLIEARKRTGGRIESCFGAFGNRLDAGPEFVHGKLPLTKALVKKAKGHLYEMNGLMYRSQNGTIFPVDDFIPDKDLMIEKMKALEKDMALSDFLDKYFRGEEYSELRRQAIKMAEGFDAADITRISVKSLLKEWNSDSVNASLKIREGYNLLVETLTQQCISNGCEICLDCKAQEIIWDQDLVKVRCSSGRQFDSSQILITVPISILLGENRNATINFIPLIPEKIKAARLMGFGTVIKILIQFRSSFWNDKRFKDKVQQIPDLNFLMNETAVPTFWTNDHNETPLITGWVGGGRATELKLLDDEEIAEKTLSCLATAFNCELGFIKEQVIGVSVFNWWKDEFARGAYSYDTKWTSDSKKILREPLLNTLFFAGEALGESTGTVEAALESAEAVVPLMLKHLNY